MLNALDGGRLDCTSKLVAQETSTTSGDTVEELYWAWVLLCCATHCAIPARNRDHSKKALDRVVVTSVVSIKNCQSINMYQVF